MAVATTLDVSELQVLVHYPHDGAGLHWHHRLLLHRVAGGDWICLTPDHDLQRHNFQTHAHRILERNTPFPGDIAAEVYAHDPISRALLQNFKRQAAIQASILGEGAVDELETVGWVVAGPSHQRFGESVDTRLLASEATGRAFTTRGVVLLDGEETFAERISMGQLEEWKARKELGDVRLLGDHRDSVGRRRLDLASAMALMHQPDDKEFPIAGVRAAKELHVSVSEGPGNFTSYHSEWVRLSALVVGTPLLMCIATCASFLGFSTRTTSWMPLPWQ